MSTKKLDLCNRHLATSVIEEIENFVCVCVCVCVSFFREVFVSFCKPASLMSPDFDVKTVASDPIQLDTIKMNSPSTCQNYLY